MNPPIFLIPWFIWKKHISSFGTWRQAHPRGGKPRVPHLCWKPCQAICAWWAYDQALGDVGMLGAELGRNWNVSEDVRINYQNAKMMWDVDESREVWVNLQVLLGSSSNGALPQGAPTPGGAAMSSARPAVALHRLHIEAGIFLRSWVNFSAIILEYFRCTSKMFILILIYISHLIWFVQLANQPVPTSGIFALSRWNGGSKDATFPQMSTSGGSAGFGRAYSSRGGSRGSSHGVSEAVSVADLQGLMFEWYHRL